MRLRHTPILALGLAAVSVAALAGCSSSPAASDSADGSTPLTLGLNYVATVEHYAPYYALTEGLFTDAGLDVTVEPGGDTPPATLLAAGQVDVAVLDTAGMIESAEEGEDFVAIATEYQMSPQSVTCRTDSGVKTPADLAGKKLGVKPTVEDYLPLIYATAGITGDDVELVPIGAQDVTTIIAGQVDCMFSTFAFNEPLSIENAGVPVTVFPMSELGLPSQGNVYAVTKETIDDPDKKAALVEFVGALGSAYSTFLEDPAAGAEYMIDNAFVDGLDLEQQTFQAEKQASFISTDYTKENGLLALDPEAWTTTAAALAELKMTDTLIDTTGMLDDLTGDAGTPKE